MESKGDVVAELLWLHRLPMLSNEDLIADCREDRLDLAVIAFALSNSSLTRS